MIKIKAENRMQMLSRKFLIKLKIYRNYMHIRKKASPKKHDENSPILLQLASYLTSIP